MTLAVADFMADGQIVGVAVAAFAAGLNMLQRRCLGRDMFAAHPARHDAVKLPRHGFIHLDSKVAQTAHALIFVQNL